MTSKEALQRIGEYSEAAITIRGTYFPPGKEPKEGERKIYLAIESRCRTARLLPWESEAHVHMPHVAVCFVGANELAVQKAKTEITRLIKEELIRLVRSFRLVAPVTNAGSVLSRQISEYHTVQFVVIKYDAFVPFSKIHTSRRAKVVTKCCRGESEARRTVRLSSSSKGLKNILLCTFNVVLCYDLIFFSY